MIITLSGKKSLRLRNSKKIDRQLNRSIGWFHGPNESKSLSPINNIEHGSILRIHHYDGLFGNIVIYNINITVDIVGMRDRKIDDILKNS